MKKLFPIFLVLTMLFSGLSNASSQNNSDFNQITKNKAELPGLNNLQERFLSVEKQELFTGPVRGTQSERISNPLTVLYDSIYRWFWNASANEWKIKPFERTSNIKYDKNNCKTSELVQTFRPDPESWLDNMKYTYTYDSKNNLTGELSQKWSSTNGMWDNYHSNTFSYDVNNNRINHLSQHWEVSAESSFQYISTFDDNNNEITFLAQKWDGSWTDLYKYFFYFDNNNNPISSVYEKYGGTSPIDSCKSFCYYDSKNNLLKKLSLCRIDKEWVNYDQNIYSYDINNNRTSNMFQKWNNNAWKNLSLNTCNYDLNNNQISDLSQEWVGSTWRNNYIYKYTYDDNNIKKSTIFYYYNNDGVSFYSGDSTCNYFHIASNGINETETPLISLYPNPASDFVYFTINKIIKEIIEYNIYSVMGVLVRSGMLDQSIQQINIEDLSRGIYVITTKSKKMTGCQKLVIQR